MEFGSPASCISIWPTNSPVANVGEWHHVGVSNDKYIKSRAPPTEQATPSFKVQSSDIAAILKRFKC